ncbi:hypothetical protein [Methylocystis heyeri]|uniref:Uncharacterized protein n=1 Tax=Methylocystis heyeri TaxID=391905 RepID=A0A6B8KIE4_9HYPH|nr:hypothetical protein [Methylocystis heyeri]QGM46288.1 hypothetical protein H2LOC_011590 [Methylocystis heyeri]
MPKGLLIVGPFSTDPEPDLEYSGFDGEFWPGVPQTDPLLELGLAPFDAIKSIKKLAEKCLGGRLIAISENQCFSEENFNFCGFDVGVLESTYEHFSFILNDILNHDGLLRSEAPSLNERRLFQTEADAMQFVNARLRSPACTRRLEPTEGQKVRVFPIWLWRHG